MANDNRETPDDNEIPESDTNQIQISNKVESRFYYGAS